MKYYLGGYYLLQLKPIEFGTKIGEQVYTCSECFNNHLLDIWAYSWTVDNDKQATEAKENFKLTDDNISVIRTWVDTKHNENKVGWKDVFTDLESAIEYRRTFFSHLEDIKILALYFDQNETKAILDEFRPESEKMGEIGLRLTLLRQIEEFETNDEILIGYDFLGIEIAGSFHTFHCHDLGAEISKKFGLKLNSYGLFDKSDEWKPIVDYLNDENNGFEPVPWFVSKTKMITNA